MTTKEEYLTDKDKRFPVELKYRVLLDMIAQEYEISVEGLEAHVTTCIIEDCFLMMEYLEAHRGEVKLNG
tara:strand:- start:570 stop:779 length:210 start_codon:yes stop_codon:yes gene_type:complete